MEAGDEERPLLRPIPPELYLTQDGDSRYTSDGTVDANGQPAVKTSTGNWRACFFVLGIEFSECLAFFAISKNLVTYLTSVLHESKVDAARNVSTWIGTTFFTPLLGAFLADTYWGKYKTIVIFLSVYAVGMLVLTVSATLPWMLRSSNHGRVPVYLGLYLTALGNGGIKPCTSAFGADQFDVSDPAERVRKGSFFNWYYFSINVGSLLSTTVLVWVQDNVGWGVGFAVPLLLMSLGFGVFLAGRRAYRYRRPGEREPHGKGLPGCCRGCLESPAGAASRLLCTASPASPFRGCRLQGPPYRSVQIFGQGCHCAGTDVGQGRPVEAMHGVPGGGGEEAAASVPRVGVLGGLLHGHGADVVHLDGAGHGDGHPRGAFRRAAGLHGRLRRAGHARAHPRLRRRAGAPGPAGHWRGPRHLAAAAHQRRPRAVRARHGLLGAAREEAAARGRGGEHRVAGACVRRAGRRRGVRGHRQSRALLRPGSGRHEEPVHRTVAACYRGGELPQLGRAGRRRARRVDPGGPRPGPPGLLLLGDGGARRPESAAVHALLH